MEKVLIIYSGQRVVTASGAVRTVAYLSPRGDVYADNGRGGVDKIAPVAEARAEGATARPAYQLAA